MDSTDQVKAGDCTEPSRRSLTWRARKNILLLYPELVISKQCNNPRGILVICKDYMPCKNL